MSSRRGLWRLSGNAILCKGVATVTLLAYVVIREVVMAWTAARHLGGPTVGLVAVQALLVPGLAVQGKLAQILMATQAIHGALIGSSMGMMARGTLELSHGGGGRNQHVGHALRSVAVQTHLIVRLDALSRIQEIVAAQAVDVFHTLADNVTALMATATGLGGDLTVVHGQAMTIQTGHFFLAQVYLMPLGICDLSPAVIVAHVATQA